MGLRESNSPFRNVFWEKDSGFSQLLCSTVFLKADALLFTCETYLKTPNQSWLESTASIPVVSDIISHQYLFSQIQQTLSGNWCYGNPEMEKGPPGDKRWTSGRIVTASFCDPVILETFFSVEQGYGPLRREHFQGHPGNSSPLRKHDWTSSTRSKKEGSDQNQMVPETTAAFI